MPAALATGSPSLDMAGAGAFWIQNKKHWCKFCKIWISGNPIQVKQHETGNRHKFAVIRFHRSNEREKRLKDREERQISREFARIQRAAGTSSPAGATGAPRVDSRPAGRRPHQAASSRGRWSDKEPEATSGDRGGETEGEGNVQGEEDTGLYVVDGHVYLEARVHADKVLVGTAVEVAADAVSSQLPRSSASTTTKTTTTTGVEQRVEEEGGSVDWYPGVVAQVQTRVNQGVREWRYRFSIQTDHGASHNVEASLDDVRMHVAPPPPPCDESNKHWADDAELLLQGRDTSTGVGGWITVDTAAAGPDATHTSYAEPSSAGALWFDDNPDVNASRPGAGHGSNASRHTHGRRLISSAGGRRIADVTATGNYRGIQLADLESAPVTASRLGDGGVHSAQTAAPGAQAAVSFRKRKGRRKRHRPAL